MKDPKLSTAAWYLFTTFVFFMAGVLLKVPGIVPPELLPRFRIGAFTLVFVIFSIEIFRLARIILRWWKKQKSRACSEA